LKIETAEMAGDVGMDAHVFKSAAFVQGSGRGRLNAVKEIFA
jgi:hypothetical protein